MNHLLVLFLGLCSALSPLDRTHAEPAKPNILWLVAEDINPHLGCFGDAVAVTPHLDRFAARSLRYPNCWSTAPVCAPARTALITGMYPTSIGAEHMRSQVAIPPFMRLYPELMRDAGYYCVNNNKEDYNLERTGRIWDESSTKAHWRNRKPAQPFLAVFNFNITHESQIRKRPHTLSTDPAKVRVPSYHPDTPEVRHDWAQYYDNLTTMDAQVAARLKELDEDGLAQDTIVFFYGDNGSGMPRSKRWPLNSGLSVPLIVHVPDKFKNLAPRDYQPGAVTKRLVSFVDFAPTLLSLAEVQPPSWMQGRAFMGKSDTPPRKHIFGLRGRMDERQDLVRSVRNERYIYVRNYMPHLIYGQYISYMFETPTTRVWKQLYDSGQLLPPRTFFWERKPVEELYDLQSDPDEVKNLAGSPALRLVQEELNDALENHLLEIRDKGFLPEAERYRRCRTLSIYEFGADDLRYPLGELLNTANIATQLTENSAKQLLPSLKHAEAGIRYWAVMGLLIRGSNAVVPAVHELRPLLEDPSPSVQIVAAQALGLWGAGEDLQAALRTLQSLCDPEKNGAFAALEALSAIDALGERAEPALSLLRSIPRQDPAAPARAREYTGRMLNRLVGD